MANFNTHVSVAAVASLAAAGFVAKAQLISFDQVLWLTLLGTVGGLLPDIDAHNSRPTRLLFNLLAVLGAFVAVQVMQGRHESYWVLAAAAVAYLFVRYGVFEIFNRFTEHRGVFHSLLAAVFFALAATCISDYFLHWDAVLAWLNGLIIAFGFVVHLLLDEIHSVDLTNRRMKKSFGTALKVYHYQNIPVSLLLLAATLTLAWFAPKTDRLQKTLATLNWTTIQALPSSGT